MCGELTICDDMTDDAYERFFTYEVCTPEFGRYLGKDIPRRFRRRKNYTHFWLRFEDGTILDPTANQFGDTDPLRILRADDDRQNHYQVFPVEMSRISSEYQPWGPGNIAHDWLQKVVNARYVFATNHRDLVALG